MKIKPSLHHLFRFGAYVLISVSVVSCQMPKSDEPIASKAGMKSNWVKISSQPPTYYPRGVSSDIPTDHSSGEWVYTEDAYGTRYFIPVRVGSMSLRQTLIHEALAARSATKMRRIEAEDHADSSEANARMLKKTPLVILGTILSFGACPEWLAETDFAEEWHSSKRQNQ